MRGARSFLFNYTIGDHEAAFGSFAMLAVEGGTGGGGGRAVAAGKSAAKSLLDDAGGAAKQPLKVALGLTDNGELFTFARQRNATTYFEYLNTRNFDPDAWAQLMDRADEIHFNTGGSFSFQRFGRWARDDGQLRVMKGAGTVTNWEFREVLTNPAWRAKLKF